MEFTDKQFPHEKMEVVQVAERFLAETAEILEQMPRGESSIKDQFKRAGDSVYLNTCEGAGRFSGPDKARFYDIARGSATECAAVLKILEIRKLAPEAMIERTRSELHRAVCMLTVLARKVRNRKASGF